MYHTISICEDIADRMKNPYKLKQVVEDAIRENAYSDVTFEETSLVNGFPGIACFYGMMDRLFPEENWGEIAHLYLKSAIETLERNSSVSLSLFDGITGLSFALTLCSQGNTRYKKIINKLNDFIVHEVERTFLKEISAFRFNNKPIPPRFYSLSNGLSGIFAYTLFQKEDHSLQHLTERCVKELVEIFKRPTIVGGVEIPRWYIPPENQLTEEERKKYPEGSFLLSMPLGISGLLSALSIAVISGFYSPGLKETITMMAEWLRLKGEWKEGIPSWSNTISFKKGEQKTVTHEEISRDTWWYGIPAVSRSLYFAGKATKNEGLISFAEDATVAMFSKTKKEWNAMGTSFVHGRAGILTFVYRMAQSTQNTILWEQVKELERDLIGFFRPRSEFGYQMVHVDQKGEYHWMNNPSLLYGSSGVALSLLGVQNREEFAWDRIFLTI